MNTMPTQLGFEEVGWVREESVYSEGTSALRLDGARCPLKFRLTGTDREGLEALRHARRSLLREERILGRDSGEPSLEDALFSATEVVWAVLPGEREWCMKKLTELLARANRVLSEMRSAANGLPSAGPIS